MDDYEEATGECGINDSTKNIIMMQLLPASLKVAIRDILWRRTRHLLACPQTEYLETIIVQRCEFDEFAMGSAIPTELMHMMMRAHLARGASAQALARVARAEPQ